MTAATKSQRFVEHLHNLDRGAIATLRRSARQDPGSDAPCFPYVEPFIPETMHARHPERRAYYLAAAMFALKERHGGVSRRFSGNLGASASRLYRGRERSPSIEHRFIVLLDADADQLPHRLRQMMSLLKADDVPVDWPRLVADLTYWDTDNRLAQQRWARSFYGADRSDPASADAGVEASGDAIESSSKSSSERTPK